MHLLSVEPGGSLVFAASGTTGLLALANAGSMCWAKDGLHVGVEGIAFTRDDAGLKCLLQLGCYGMHAV